MHYRLLAEKLQTSALIQGLPVLQLTLQLGPCIQIYTHQVVECVDSNHSPISSVGGKKLRLASCSKVCASHSALHPSLYFCTSKRKIDKAYQTSQENSQHMNMKSLDFAKE
jgi:hypothetical protein